MLRLIAESRFLFTAVNFLVSSLSISVSFAIYYSHEFYTNEDIAFHFQLKCDCSAWRSTARHSLSIPSIIYIFLLFQLHFICILLLLFLRHHFLPPYVDCSFILICFVVTFYPEDNRKK